jgi:hypothetical protein
MLFILSYGWVNGQSVFTNSDFELDTNKVTFGIRSEAYNNSNAITSSILNTVLYGGYISVEERQRIIGRTKSTNNTGSILNTSIFYVRRIDSLFGKETSNISFFLNIADRQENLSIFSQNAAQLILFGNKQFAGESVRLTPFDFNRIHYSQFQIGLTKSFKSGNKFQVGLSFLYGQSNQNSNTERLNLLISKYGDRIGTDTELSIFQTDQNNTNFMSYNGAGASIDLSGVFNLQLLNDTTNTAKFHISIQDFGVIQWHASSTEIKADTFYTYEGIYVQNVFDPNSITSGSNPKEIFDSISTVTHKSHTTFIPSTIRFYLEQRYNNCLFTIGGAQRLNAFYYPFFYGKAGYYFNPKWLLSGQINYGGYGLLGGGLEIQYITPKYNFKLGSTNLEGFIAPTKIAGQSIYFLLSYKI